LHTMNFRERFCTNGGTYDDSSEEAHHVSLPEIVCG
jgi:hypothetical protein